MASQIEIANLAMLRLGEPPLTALSDEREAAYIISELWDALRDDELRAHAWRFAIKRQTLTDDVAVPDWGFTAQYTLPGDCVRVLQISEVYGGVDLTDYRTGDTALYRIEGDKILSYDTGSLNIRFVTNSIPVGLWDASFASVFAGRLAVELCERMTESTSKKQMAREGYTIAMRRARQSNALEAPPEPIPDDSWVLSRQTW